MAIRQITRGLTDLSPMPFGKAHVNVPMQDVPVEYLHWIWHNVSPIGKQAEQILDIRDYIKRNLVALKQERPDLIWD